MMSSIREPVATREEHRIAVAVRRPTEKTAHLEEAIHGRHIRAQVEVDHTGEYIAIDINGEDAGPSQRICSQTANDLRSRHPDVLDAWNVRVIRPAVVRACG